MTDLCAGDYDPGAAAKSRDIVTPVRKLAPDLEAVLRPFLEQSSPPTSILAIGCRWLWAESDERGENVAQIAARNDAMLLRLVADKDTGLAIVARTPIPPSGDGPGGGRMHTLESLARQMREPSSDTSGDHLILLPSHVLEKMVVPFAGDFSFRAVVTLPSQNPVSRVIGMPGSCSALCSTMASSALARSRSPAAKRAAFSPAMPFDQCIASALGHAVKSVFRA